DGKEVELDVTWTCTTEYNGKNIGATYTFVPSAAGYKWECDIPSVMVKIVDAGFTYKSSSRGFAFSDTPFPYVIRGNADGSNSIYDATGFNNLLPKNTYSAATVNMAGLHKTVSSAGGKTLPEASSGETSVTLTDGANLSEVYGGGYGKDHNVKTNVYINKATVSKTVYGGGNGAAVTGNAEINLKNGSTVSGDVYAGSKDAEFIGDSVINIESGATVVGKVYATGTGAFDGNVVINVADGAEIGGISLGENEANYPDSVTINVTSDFDMDLIDCLDKKIVKVFVDGDQQHIVSNVDFGDFRIEVENGAGVVLPAVKITTLGNNTYEVPETDYTWTSDNFDKDISGEYVFTLKFNDNYSFVNDAHYNNTLVVYVKVASADVRTVSEITTTVPQSISVPEGTALKDVNILSSIEAYTYGAGQTANDAVPCEIRGITWTSSDYNANEVGEYTFTMVLPDGYTMSNPVTVTVSVMKVERPTITAINVPVTETYFTNGVVTSPKFYDRLEVEVLYSDTTTDTVTLRGITWKCNGTYDASTVGEYEFVIDPSSIDGKYEVREGLLEETTITVNVLDATYGNNTTYYRTNTATVIPVYFIDNNDGTTAYRDLTGCNMIRTVGSSAAASVVGGGNYRVDTTPGQTARIDMSSGILATIVGGSHGNDFTGNAVLNFFGTASVTDVVAGTLNEAFNGNTHITVADEVEIKRIVAGSEYRAGAKTSSSGTTVGSEDAVAYNGIVTITIKDGFAGSIGSIEKTTTGKLILNCPSSFPYARYVDVTDPAVEVYVDGVRVQYVTEIKAPDTAVYNVALGTQNVSLPTTFTATINGTQDTIDGVTWVCENYDAERAGKYTFTPVIPEKYDISSVDITNISVVVRVLTANAGQSVITAFAPINTVLASLGTAQKDLALPSTITATVNGQSTAVEVDSWICANYDGSVYGAEYTFTATVSGEYTLSAAAPTVTVKITNAKIVEIYLPVTETTFPKGAVENPVFYNTLKVKLDNGTVTEISGFEWVVKDYNKDTVGKYTATIKSAPANCEFASSLNVPSIAVTVTRQQYDVMRTDANVYLCGIPTVIDGDTTEVYLYDITGCNRTDPTNILSKNICGGGPANSSSLETTMVEMRGGKLSSISGGSRDSTKITDTAYVYVL
ncbi:MAG: hypothetical protein II982_04225, partial [Clostridia bacterium]|nr:hypothetical protein [Clostridia bacterium]